MADSETLPGRVRVHVGVPAVVAGAGIQISPIHVLTCWHVTQTDDEDPPIAVEVPDAPGALVPARIVWAKEIGTSGDGDMVVLRTETHLRSATARLADWGTADVEVRMVGYPARTPTQVLATGRVVGPVDPVTGWRQIDRLSASTVTVERGFSGAGVFDASGAVVGMVVAKATLSQQAVAWMIPVSAWAVLLPDTLPLPDMVQRPSVRRNTIAPPQVSFADKIRLARHLEGIPLITTPDGWELLVDSLPPHIRRAVRSYRRLGLDTFGLIRTVLEFQDGVPALYRVLCGLVGPESVSLREFCDDAVRMGLLDTEEDR
jgi:hypothetical protein